MEKLSPKNYPIAAPLLLEIEHQSVIRTILSRSTPGHVYVDRLENPTFVLAQFKHRVYISGTPPFRTDDLEKFILTEVFNNCRQADVPMFRLTANTPMWYPILKEALNSREPLVMDYQCYQYQILNLIKPVRIPEEFTIQSVDEALIQESFENREDLLEEMCSERESVDAFFKNSFGVAAFIGSTLAGWCLSEYNLHDRCEIGIATLPPFQRQGLGRAMTETFLNLAHMQGINTVLWHCFKANIASRKTALSAGFRLVEDHPVLMVYLDTAVNLAVHGNIEFDQKNFLDSLDWYQKALSENNPQSWIAWKAACAASCAGQVDRAFAYLNKAIDLGFRDLDIFVHSEHITALKRDPRWDLLTARLNQN